MKKVNSWQSNLFEPKQDTSNNFHVWQAKIKLSLVKHIACSEPELHAQWVAKDPSFLQARSDDSCQTVRIHRLI